MPLTTKGRLTEPRQIYKKRFEAISFSMTFAAADGVSWTGLKIRGHLRDANDSLIWDSGEVSASVASGAASATITIPSATTGSMDAGTYYVDFIYWGNSVVETATKTYVINLEDGPTDL